MLTPSSSIRALQKPCYHLTLAVISCEHPQASLSVAMGQRAPNRAAGREVGRGLGSSLHAAAPSPRRDAEPRCRLVTE